MSLISAAERFANLDHSAVVFNATHCLHSQDRYATCTACLGVCPTEAIDPGKPPAFHPDKCQRCLACLTVCPVGAYTADDQVASLLNAVTHLDGNGLELLCEKNPQASLGLPEPSTGIRIRGCLAGLGTGAYLALAALGLERVVVRMDACADCEWESLPEQIKTQVNQANQLLKGWGKEDFLRYTSELDSREERPLWEATNPPLSRRDLFRQAIRQGKITLARSLEKGQSDPGDRPGRDRRRILSAIAHLPAPDLEEGPQLGSLNFASLSVSETCTACGVCGRACPTGALQFEKNEVRKEYKLILQARNCIGCELCIHICAPIALTINRTPTFMQVFAEKEVILHEGQLVKCSSCGALTAALPGIALCPLCEFRRAHPFGSILPPGLKSVQPPAVEER